MTNLGTRIRTALDALSGNLRADLDANTGADTRRDEALATATAAIADVGRQTTELKAEVDRLAARAESGSLISAEDFARVKAAVDSLDAAFPDDTQAAAAETEPASA
ncbi:MAG: hypothetical protein RQ833_11660 [Sphingomonadaceae bacterium]|nr:hypothetical protein [Sphingomonadaceae bacterium]